AVMFLSFVVERAEQGVLDRVDEYVDLHLAHRFERLAAESGQVSEVVRQNTQALVRATEKLAEHQATVGAKALADTDRRRTEAEARSQQRLTAALESALERTLEGHSRRLAVL